MSVSLAGGTPDFTSHHPRIPIKPCPSSVETRPLARASMSFMQGGMGLIREWFVLLGLHLYKAFPCPTNDVEDAHSAEGKDELLFLLFAGGLTTCSLCSSQFSFLGRCPFCDSFNLCYCSLLMDKSCTSSEVQTK